MDNTTRLLIEAFEAQGEYVHRETTLEGEETSKMTLDGLFDMREIAEYLDAKKQG